MKNFVALLIVVIIIFTLTSCSYFNFFTDTEQQAESSQEPEEAPEETAALHIVKAANDQFGLALAPDESFNPITTTSAANQNLAPLMYEGLFEINPDFMAENVLCKSFEVTNDLRTYTFTLNSGVNFSDGSKLTAADVAYSLNEARWNENSVYSSRFHACSSITALSDDTLEIVMDVPYEELPLILDVPIIKEGSIASSVPLGTGPYVLRKDGQEQYLEPNSYWLKTAPFSRIYLYEAVSVEEITDSFQTEKIDFVVTDPTGISQLTFHNDYEFWNYGTSVMQYVGFNIEREVFARKAARTAVGRIIDREGITGEIFKGLATASAIPAPPGSKLYRDDLAQTGAYDPDEALRILEDAGYREIPEYYDDGILYFDNGLYMAPCSIIFLVNSENQFKVQAATEIAEALRGLKFKVDLQVLGYDDYMSALRKGEFDMFYGEIKMTADFDLYNLLGTRGYVSYGGIYSSDLDSRIYSALENSGAAYDVYKYILDEGIFVPVLFKDYAVVTVRARITGVEPTLWNSFYGLADWVVSSSK